MVHRYGTSLLHGPAACGQNLPAAAALIPGLPSEGWKRKESNLKAFRTACSRNLSGAARRLDALLRGLGALDGKAPSAEAYRPEATARHLVDTRSLPEKGALLHFQAGDGGFLEGFHALRPQWELSAIESGADFMKLLDKEFLTAACNAGYRDADLSRAFDDIVVTKPLDTVDKPLEALRWLCRRLAEGGTFYCHQPPCIRSGFSLCGAAHGMKLRIANLVTLCQAAGLSIEYLDTQDEAIRLCALKTVSSRER